MISNIDNCIEKTKQLTALLEEYKESVIISKHEYYIEKCQNDKISYILVNVKTNEYKIDELYVLERYCRLHKINPYYRHMIDVVYYYKKLEKLVRVDENFICPSYGDKVKEFDDALKVIDVENINNKIHIKLTDF